MNEDRNVARAAALDTATISDALDRHGLAGQCFGIQPVDRGFRLSGRAYTLRYGPLNPAAPGTVGDFIDDVPPGSVIAIDNDGRPDATVWGDILTLVASRRGIAGTVIDGTCRDVALSLEIRYPLYSRHVYMRTGKDRVQLEAVNGPVAIGGICVNPGDLLRGDADGIVVIPTAQEETVLATAEAIHAAEMAIREAVQSGMRLDEARKANRYHALQSRSPADKG